MRERKTLVGFIGLMALCVLFVGWLLEGVDSRFLERSPSLLLYWGITKGANGANASVTSHGSYPLFRDACSSLRIGSVLQQ